MELKPEPRSEEELRKQITDEEHLKLLSLGYMVSAGSTAFFSLFGLLYFLMGVMLAVLSSEAGLQGGDEPPPIFFGLFFGAIGLGVLVIGLTFAALKWRTARLIKERRSPVFCQVIAALSCLEVPYGTLLGVLTFVVFSRPSVAALFRTQEDTVSGGT
ncbi:MAG: hypothetical protein ACYC1U_01250 [Candidatus Aquicultorales bacterium]